jgi:P4 family phage/plasmid primase-like protien
MGLDRIARIKESVSVIDYAINTLRLPVRKAGDRTVSLAPDSHNPTALLIDKDSWYDFKLGIGGDVIDLCAAALHNGDKGAAIRELSGNDPSVPTWWMEYTQNLCNNVQFWHENLRDEDREYLHKRKITDETIERLKIGFAEGRLTIPYFKNGAVVYNITRERDGTGPKYMKMKRDELNDHVPWGLDTLQRDRQPLVITEGVFDAISFEQEGYRVLSPMGGRFNSSALKQVLDVCRWPGQKVFLCFDSDESGQRFQKDISELLFERGIADFVCGSLPDGVKDISDYYVAGGDLAALIADAQNGIDTLCRSHRDKDGFRDFVLRAGRFVPRADMAELFENANIDAAFPKSWLKELKKQALAAPSEDSIVKDLVKNTRLKYFERLGFYEYRGGVWKKRDDTEVAAYVADAYGHHRAGRRVASTLSLLKTATVDAWRGSANIINFNNCVFDIGTGKTRDHSEGDMSTNQVLYSFDDSADCPMWRSFIDDVAGGDESSMALLQEIAGYIMFPDSSLQKCFFLLGGGANGKSVFLDILTELFGRSSISNVEMSGLIEPFQRILLLHSIANISTEVRSDVKGAESVFKQIVVGDPITACYKNKDFITFRPRAKFITACNQYLDAHDGTQGFQRRIIFASFDTVFSDNPKDGEKLADKNITAKLKTELPGIFNWAYSGYKWLMETKKFTETAAHKEMIETQMKLINPLESFIDEVNLWGVYSRAQLYSAYREWAKEAGHQLMSRQRFIQKFKAVTAAHRMKINEKRDSNVRYFVFGE